MARRRFLGQLLGLPFLSLGAKAEESKKKMLKIMMKSAWGSDDPTKAAFPFHHGLALAEAGLVRHLLDGMRAFFEHHASHFEPQRFDGLCRRLAGLLSERARELTHAEMRRCGEFFHGEVRTKMLPRVRERGLNSIRLRRHREQR